jgi:hypothetical protein
MEYPYENNPKVEENKKQGEGLRIDKKKKIIEKETNENIEKLDRGKKEKRTKEGPIKEKESKEKIDTKSEEEKNKIEEEKYIEEEEEKENVSQIYKKNDLKKSKSKKNPKSKSSSENNEYRSILNCISPGSNKKRNYSYLQRYSPSISSNEKTIRRLKSWSSKSDIKKTKSVKMNSKTLYINLSISEKEKNSDSGFEKDMDMLSKGKFIFI